MAEENLAEKIERGVEYMKAAEHLVAEEKKDLAGLIRENLALSQSIAKDIKKIKRHMLWRTIMSWIWIFLFVAPIIAAFFYLPTIMKQFNEIMDVYSNPTAVFDLNIEDIKKQLK